MTNSISVPGSANAPRSWDNLYYDGNVRSKKTTVEGKRATQGEIDPGTYEFSTTVEETITVDEGRLEVGFPIEIAQMNTYFPGQSFVIPAGQKFMLCVAEGVVKYTCVYNDPIPEADRDPVVADGVSETRDRIGLEDDDEEEEDPLLKGPSLELMD